VSEGKRVLANRPTRKEWVFLLFWEHSDGILDDTAFSREETKPGWPSGIPFATLLQGPLHRGGKRVVIGVVGVVRDWRSGIGPRPCSGSKGVRCPRRTRLSCKAFRQGRTQIRVDGRRDSARYFRRMGRSRCSVNLKTDHGRLRPKASAKPGANLLPRERSIQATDFFASTIPVPSETECPQGLLARPAKPLDSASSITEIMSRAAMGRASSRIRDRAADRRRNMQNFRLLRKTLASAASVRSMRGYSFPQFRVNCLMFSPIPGGPGNPNVIYL